MTSPIPSREEVERLLAEAIKYAGESSTGVKVLRALLHYMDENKRMRDALEHISFGKRCETSEAYPNCDFYLSMDAGELQAVADAALSLSREG